MRLVRGHVEQTWRKLGYLEKLVDDGKDLKGAV
jgi:hypothetical protein